MRDSVTRVDRCRVCGRDDWLEVMSFGDKPLANGLLDPARHYEMEPRYPLEVIVCRGCWLMSTRHVVDPEVLFGQNHGPASSDSDRVTTHMRRIVEWCTRGARLAPGDLVVDIGGNIGIQSSMFQDNGLRVVGVDPARNLAQVVNRGAIPTVADSGAPDVTGPIAPGQAALVLGRQCFAHIDDVHNVLKGVDAVLAPDGLLVIEVPYLIDLLQRNQFDTIHHEHLSYFSLGPLSRLLAIHGLRVVDVERVRVHGGSIVVFASRLTVPGKPTPAVAELLAEEEQYGLSTERPYLEFAIRTRELIEELLGVVRYIVGGASRVAAYGASSDGNALLMACGFSPAEIEFCTDPTEMKQGKVLPGTHIRVESPEQAHRHQPDYYLLLPRDYAEEIMSKERDFLDAGGKFIVATPQPRIVSSAQPGRPDLDERTGGGPR